MSQIIEKHFLMNKEFIATATGFVVGIRQAFITKEAISAVALAFVTGAAAWLGQKLVKIIWVYCFKPLAVKSLNHIKSKLWK